VLWKRWSSVSVFKSLLTFDTDARCGRCVPTLPTQLAEDLYGAATSYVDKAETQLTSLSNSLGSNEQRLRRYISDINRGKWIIIASGKSSALDMYCYAHCFQTCLKPAGGHDACRQVNPFSSDTMYKPDLMSP